ncbi:hypothetical protein PTSG_06515 [Salpingoeca rosetta]|uniref:PX domain-containing protein n=1 Tax=Salpingoeca rosetta (strain ATCC 50818 / BSB-021) TaxID=946362 RepID=F2UG12_SALR5|nr:uncharacterized protein PTSG_06515 [Salpingoeca rosetta]EGD75440.1 hypothetical protein PTSG_06515 [Salpingoeca rosetta]|eukprot:XP_004991897.1 hypothetical protein PTSG_06515 [Salpingoeca rosetta]
MAEEDSSGRSAWGVRVAYTGEQRDGANLYAVSVHGVLLQAEEDVQMDLKDDDDSGSGDKADAGGAQQASAGVHQVYKHYACFVELRERLQHVLSDDQRYKEACSHFPSKWSLRSLNDRAAKLERFLGTLVAAPDIRETFVVRHFLGVYDNARLYQTLTYCPTCIFSLRRQPALLPAAVSTRDGVVVLEASCPAHAQRRRGTSKAAENKAGKLECTLCSDASVFLRWAASTIAVSAKLRACATPSTFAHTAQAHPPCVKRIPLLRAGKPIPEEELVSMCTAAVATERAAGSSFARKRLAVMFSDPQTYDRDAVNAAVHAALPHTRRHRVVLELNPTCMAAVAALPNSCFLSPRVYPLVTTTIPANMVSRSRMALIVALGELAAFNNMNAAVDINITRPFPDLTTIFDSLRSKNMGFGRYPISMSPSAGCAAVLIDLGEEVVSLNRLVDMDRLWTMALPHINKLRQSNYGLLTARSALSEARKAFMACVRPGVLERFPNLRVDFDRQTLDNLQWLVGRAQIFFVRRQPDAASFDAALVMDTCEDTAMRTDAMQQAEVQAAKKKQST